MLKDEIKKKNQKILKSILVNLSNSRFKSWDHDNLKEGKLEQIMKLNSQLKKNRVNFLNL